MQNQTSLIAVLFIFLFGHGVFASQSFEEAMAKHRNSDLVLVPKVGEGLPFYTPKTLTPVWDLSQSPGIVEIPDFRLVDQDGKTVDQKIFEGTVTIVGFIFTSCAGFCPILIRDMQAIEREMKVKGQNARFVVFSVDPEFDTPERLAQYAKIHKIATDKNWTLLTGAKETLYRLAKETFASEVRKLESPTNENMRKFAHTEHFYVIDQRRRLRSIVNGTRIDVTERAPAAVAQLLAAAESGR